MSKGLLHRRRMMCALTDNGWEYGKRYVYMGSTDTSIMDDPNYALSPYYPYPYSTIVFFDNNQRKSFIKNFSNEQCIDYWDAKDIWRVITNPQGTDEVRLCAYIPNMHNMALAYFPSTGYENAYFLYKGIDVPPIYSDIYEGFVNYYSYTTNKRFDLDVSMCGTYMYIPLDTSVANFNQISIYTGAANTQSRVFEFGENYNYIDYWGFNSNSVRSVNLHTTARYILFGARQDSIDITYIKYRSTGEYIWKGKNV